jgi:hypothetical protein
MINRRSVPALHRACLHLMQQPETEKPGGIPRPDLLIRQVPGLFRDAVRRTYGARRTELDGGNNAPFAGHG